MYQVFQMFDVPVKKILKELDDSESTHDAPEVWGGYTNYEYDILELPDINDKIKDFNKKVGYADISYDTTYVGRVIYWCETFEDLLKAIKVIPNNYGNIGGIDDAVRFNYNGTEYVYDVDEIAGNAIIIPTSLEEEIENYLKSTRRKNKTYEMLKSIYDYTFEHYEEEE